MGASRSIHGLSQSVQQRESPAPVNLGSAASYAILAGATVTNAGASFINGDLGLSPGTAVTGFGPGTENGTKRISPDADVALAKIDLTAAFNDASWTDNKSSHSAHWRTRRVDINSRAVHSPSTGLVYDHLDGSHARCPGQFERRLDLSDAGFHADGREWPSSDFD